MCFGDKGTKQHRAGETAPVLGVRAREEGHGSCWMVTEREGFYKLLRRAPQGIEEIIWDFWGRAGGGLGFRHNFGNDTELPSEVAREG